MHYNVSIDEADMQQPQVHSFCDTDVVVFSARSPDKTTVNEDSAGLIAVDDTHGILIVADGAGGGSSRGLTGADYALAEAMAPLPIPS